MPRAVLALLVATALALGASGAAASASPFTYDGCVGDNTGCTATSPSNALDSTHALVVSPNGKDLYVSTYSFSGVSHFRLGSDGTPNYVGCIGSITGCTPDAADAVHNVTSLTMTPDGKNLYAATYDSKNISHFTIGANGNPTFANCIGEHTGCTATSPVGLLDTVRWVAASPDGKNLYAGVDYKGNNISHFSIGAGGDLTLKNCIGNLTGCTATAPAGALDSTWGVTASPDGKHLYSFSHGEGTVSYLTIGAGGDLTFTGCLGQTAGCTTTTPSTALAQASSAILAPDGKHLYVTGEGGTLSRFTINTAGAPVFDGCLGTISGCSSVPAGTFGDPRSLAVTPDGKSLFVGDFSTPTLSRYAVGSGGGLTFDKCFGLPSACSHLPNQPLNGVLPLGVNPTGSHLYAGAYYSDDVARFDIADVSAPAITITVPANGAHYKQGQRVLASYSCSDPDGPTDITLCAGPAQNGKPIDTSTPGSHSFTVQAADKAGNASKKTVHYTADTTPSSPPVLKGFPQNRGCVPKGLKLHVSVHPTGLKQALVFLDGTQIARSTKPKFKVTIAPRQLSSGRHKIVIERDYKSGTKRHSSFSFATCKGGGKSPHIRTQGTPDKGSCTAKAFKIKVTITGAVIKTIVVKLDAKRFSKPNKAKFTLSIDTSKLKAGAHRLTITAADKHENSSVSVTDFVRCG